MAEKGFGVKEINLIGPSGTPTITSPNNLNLNANNVAISTNVSIGGTLSVTGNVSVGGTLTYEDVTNIDSVGLITARKGIVSSGVVTATAFDGGIKVVAANSVAATVYPVFAGSGATQSGNLDLKTDNSLTYNSLSGELTAVKFTGDGSSLTSLPAATPTDSDIQVAYTVTANGSSAYRFAGNGVVSTADNPDLYLIRGQKYRFINNSGGSHPFQIRVSDGGSAYSTGVTNNGASSGNIDFAPTFDSPGQLVYQCTSHGGMVGNIYISDGKYDTTPTQFHIEVDRSGNQTGYDGRAGGASGTPIVFNNVVRTRGTANSALNTSTGKITVPVDGVYFLEASAYTTSGNFLSQGWFTEGSSRMTHSDITEDEGTDQVQASGMHFLSANTEVGFHPYGPSASSITIAANVYHTWFRVTLIG